MKLFLLWLLFLPVAVIAEEAPEIHIIATEPGLDLSPFAGRPYQLHPYGEPSPSEAPSARERDGYFQEAQLLVQVVDWDELEKDLLFLRARHQALPELKKKYPSFSERSLETLQRLTKKRRAQ